MKKFVLIFLLLQIILILHTYKIESISGEKNVKKVINAKPIYMIFTANNVLIWKESYEKLVKKEIAKGNKMPTFKEMKKKMYKNF